MKLAKPALDIGLNTNQLDAMLAFWQEQAHVPYAELLKVGGGLHQHRHAIGDSVLKINHPRDPAPTSTPSGLRRLELFTAAVDEPVDLLDPDGNEVTLRPPHPEAANLCLHMVCNDLQQTMTFYRDVLALPAVDDYGVAVGASRIAFSPGTVATVERQAIGFRYMTMQVYDVVGEHQNIVEQGGTEGMAPVRLGDVAYISFVRDPDGNWIEISQRKSITGSLD